MTWRLQAEDPIEKCEEAKHVWVMFKKDVPFKKWREINFPELCEVFVSWIDNKKKIKVLGDPLWPGEPMWANPSANQSSIISPDDISHWQLIPTPAIPLMPTEQQYEELRRAIQDAINHPEKTEIVAEPRTGSE